MTEKLQQLVLHDRETCIAALQVVRTQLLLGEPNKEIMNHVIESTLKIMSLSDALMKKYE